MLGIYINTQNTNKNKCPHLLTHTDLHNGVAYQRLTQIFVFLLFKMFDVIPCCSHKLPGGTITKTHDTVSLFAWRRSTGRRTKEEVEEEEKKNNAAFALFLILIRF